MRSSVFLALFHPVRNISALLMRLCVFSLFPRTLAPPFVLTALQDTHFVLHPLFLLHHFSSFNFLFFSFDDKKTLSVRHTPVYIVSKSLCPLLFCCLYSLRLPFVFLVLFFLRPFWRDFVLSALTFVRRLPAAFPTSFFFVDDATQKAPFIILLRFHLHHFFASDPDWPRMTCETLLNHRFVSFVQSHHWLLPPFLCASPHPSLSTCSHVLIKFFPVSDNLGGLSTRFDFLNRLQFDESIVTCFIYFFDVQSEMWFVYPCVSSQCVCVFPFDKQFSAIKSYLHEWDSPALPFR